MPDVLKDFSFTPGQVWLNAASEGPLPQVSAQALQAAISWKMSPEKLTMAKFAQVPAALKQSIARLLQAPEKEIILGNSATYGIHLLANGLNFKPGDEILMMQNDFPSDILPWLHLGKRGIAVTQLKAKAHVLTVEELAAAISKRTKLVCLPYVHSFSGWTLDIAAMGELCQKHGIVFVVNVSQAVGAFDVDVKSLFADAVVCAGYKWLLGPYGTGFCWIKQSLLGRLEYPQAYWISLLDEKSLNAPGDLQLPMEKSARRYDIFGTANFFNYVPWAASIDYILAIGLKDISLHNQVLTSQFLQGIDRAKFNLISPDMPEVSSSIIVFSHKDPAHNGLIFEHLKTQGFHGAFWKGNLRLSIHLYNTAFDIKHLLTVLNSYAP